MDTPENYGIVFTRGFDNRYNDRILHILCKRGNVGFTFRRMRYNIGKGDYAIITEVSLSSYFTMSPDFEGFIMWLSHDFIDAASIRSNYGVFGKLSLMRNPVMRLNEKDFVRCADDLARLRERLNESHLFRDEILGSLLAAHILDLYDIHSRLDHIDEIPERAAKLMNDFINLLQSGEYFKSRELGHYASLLCITPPLSFRHQPRAER
ncbi:MAG: AraC family transcriptional regulator [Muribaculum sp.]|nr:AraC family transcriptional regulator [Muribaculum sp.]